MASRGEFVRIDGYSDFMAGLRDSPRRIQVAVRGSMRESARKVVARAATYAPRRTGALAQQTKIVVGPNRITIEWTVPYAGVQDWGVKYLRRNRGTDVTATRGIKKAYSQQKHVAGGYHEVNMDGNVPRFAFRARDELADSIGEELLTSMCKALVATGNWAEVA